MIYSCSRNSQFQGIWHPLLASEGTRHEGCAFTYIQENIHTHMDSSSAQLATNKRQEAKQPVRPGRARKQFQTWGSGLNTLLSQFLAQQLRRACSGLLTWNSSVGGQPWKPWCGLGLSMANSLDLAAGTFPHSWQVITPDEPTSFFLYCSWGHCG